MSTCHCSPVSGSRRGFSNAVVRAGGADCERSVGWRAGGGAGVLVFVAVGWAAVVRLRMGFGPLDDGKERSRW